MGQQEASEITFSIRCVEVIGLDQLNLDQPQRTTEANVAAVEDVIGQSATVYVTVEPVCDGLGGAPNICVGSEQAIGRSFSDARGMHRTIRDPIRRCEFVAVGQQTQLQEGDEWDRGRATLFSLAYRASGELEYCFHRGVRWAARNLVSID